MKLLFTQQCLIKRRAISQVATAIALATLVVIIGFGVYIDTTLNVSGSTSTVTETPFPTSYSTTTVTTVGYPNSTQTMNSTLGLKLVLSINSTLFFSGKELNVSVAIENTLPSVNNVSGEWNWALPSLRNFSYADLPCPRWDTFRVFSGYLDQSNISTATPMYLWPASLGYPSCPNWNFSNYLFQPSSSIVNVSSSMPPNYDMSFHMSDSEAISGAYFSNVSYPSSQRSPPPFPQGTYTIVAGDEWRQFAMLHFQVDYGNTSTTNSTSTNTSSSYTCIQSGTEQHIFVTVVSDANKFPIEGANVSGALRVTMNNQNYSYQIIPQFTPSNGTVELLLPPDASSCTVGTYFISILTSSGFSSVTLFPPTLHLAQTVAVTIGVPSGKILDMHISNAAQCGQNGTTIVNGTGFFC